MGTLTTGLQTRNSSSKPDADTYLTDGRRLYRVVRGFAAPAEESFALLEDCRTIEIESYEPAELWSMKLRTVDRQAGGC